MEGMNSISVYQFLTDVSILRHAARGTLLHSTFMRTYVGALHLDISDRPRPGLHSRMYILSGNIPAPQSVAVCRYPDILQSVCQALAQPKIIRNLLNLLRNFLFRGYSSESIELIEKAINVEHYVNFWQFVNDFNTLSLRHKCRVIRQKCRTVFLLDCIQYTVSVCVFAFGAVHVGAVARSLWHASVWYSSVWYANHWYASEGGLAGPTTLTVGIYKLQIPTKVNFKPFT